MNIRQALFGLLMIALMGCAKDDVSPRRLFIKEIHDPVANRDVYEYEDGRLISFKRFFGDFQEITTDFHYDGDRLLKVEVKRSSGFEQIIELTFGEDGLRREEKVTTIANNEITYTRKGTFNYMDGVLKSIKYTFNDVNSPGPDYEPSETEFEWENGNITKMEVYFFDSNGRYFFGHKTMTYDDKRNYSNQDIAFIYTTGVGSETTISANNVIATTENYGETFVDAGRYQYTYNSSGYPIGYIYKIDSHDYGPIQLSYK